MDLFTVDGQNKHQAMHKLYSLVLYIGSALGCFILFYMAIDTSVWVDEAYTMGIVKYPVKELIYVTAKDVHPPFYYLIVKFVLFITGIENIYSSIIIARVVSIIPYILIWILSITCIRKWFGTRCSALFSLCMLYAPHMITNALEIRMYSWAMLFVFAVSLICSSLVINQEKVLLKFVVLLVCVLFAFYTHYFACICVAFILFLFLVWIIISKHEYLPYFGIMCAIDALLYMPWMLIALRQIKTVSSDYWIAPIDRNSLSRYFWYAFRTNENTVGMICGFILVIFSILGFISAIKNFKERNNILALINMLLMPLTVVTGVIASFLLRPIFVERYMLPAIACFWFGFSYLISKLKKGNGIYVVVSLVLLGIGISEYPLVLEDIKGNRAEMEEIEDLFLEMNENDIIVHTSLNTEVPVAMYCPNSEHFLIEESSTLAIDQLVFEHVEGVLKTNEIDGLLKSGKTLWCFVYPSIENINEEWKSEISKATYVGTYSIDWCDFYVYKWN